MTEPTHPPAPNPPTPAPEATAAAARTYPPTSPRNAALERDSEGPDPQAAKLDPALATYPGEPVTTIAQEQRERSDEMAATGVEAWKASHDERDPDDQPRTVPGVGPTSVGEGQPPQAQAGTWAGSTRSTPEARDYQPPGGPKAP
jgi:hypothetical protein